MEGKERRAGVGWDLQEPQIGSRKSSREERVVGQCPEVSSFEESPGVGLGMLGTC